MMKITAAQCEMLCRFFEENPEVLRGYKKTQKTVNVIQAKWKRITPRLNALGPPRSYNGWPKYLSNVKTKLKRKRIKWRQNKDGSGPIICNTADFSQIYLRMLQVLKGLPLTLDTETSQITLKSQDTDNSQDFQDANTSEAEIDEPTKIEDSEEVYEEVIPWQETDKLVINQNNESSLSNSSYTIKIQTAESPEPFVPQEYLNINDSDDEFETFGKNVAKQLRTLPLGVALETQETLLAIIRKQRMRYLTESSNRSLDPL